MALHNNIGGATGDTFQVGKAGPKLKNNSGAVQFRNAADDDYANMNTNVLLSNAPWNSSTPGFRMNGDAATGVSGLGTSVIDFSISGDIQFRLTTSFTTLGKDGGGVNAPIPQEMKASTWESASTSSNVDGEKWSFDMANGTGSGAPGFILYTQSAPKASGVEKQNLYTPISMKLSADYLYLTRSEDVQLYLGIAADKPTDMVGPSIVMKAVTAEPTAIDVSLGAIYWFGNILKCIQPDGTIGTLNFTGDGA